MILGTTIRVECGGSLTLELVPSNGPELRPARSSFTGSYQVTRSHGMNTSHLSMYGRNHMAKDDRTLSHRPRLRSRSHTPNFLDGRRLSTILVRTFSITMILTKLPSLPTFEISPVPEQIFLGTVKLVSYHHNRLTRLCQHQQNVPEHVTFFDFLTIPRVKKSQVEKSNE